MEGQIKSYWKDQISILVPQFVSQYTEVFFYSLPFVKTNKQTNNKKTVLCHCSYFLPLYALNISEKDHLPRAELSHA